MISILFVCYGNTCRSPALQGVFEDKIAKMHLSSHYYVDSCGVQAYFSESGVDKRMYEAAFKKGISLKHTPRPFEAADFQIFDYIFVVTERLRKDLAALISDEELKKKVILVTKFSKNYSNQDIPDPYYDQLQGFEIVFSMIEDAVDGLVNRLSLLENEFL